MAWKRVCAVSDIEPDSVQRFEVDGMALVVVSIGDDFRAMPPMCPHEEEALDESGVCAKGVLTCAEHLWQWRLDDGQPCGPEENDRELILYPTKREGDDVLVSIEEERRYEYESDEFDF